MFCDCCLSLNIFYTFDIAMSQLSVSHEYSYRLGCICHVCENCFQMKTTPTLFWFHVWDLNILDIFYKSQNFNWWPVCPVITPWTYTFLSPCSLENKKRTMSWQLRWILKKRFSGDLFFSHFRSNTKKKPTLGWIYILKTSTLLYWWSVQLTTKNWILRQIKMRLFTDIFIHSACL